MSTSTSSSAPTRRAVQPSNSWLRPSQIPQGAALQVLALALGVALAAVTPVAQAQGTRPTATTNVAKAAAPPAASAAPPVVWPSDARISLELKRVPLTTFLSALSAQSGLRFRLATVPDVEVSVSLQNAPLQQAVRDVLALQGFDLRPGPDAFWLVPSLPAGSVAAAPARRKNPAGAPAAKGAADAAPPEPRGSDGWRWWTGTQPPPRWMAPLEEDQVAYDGPPSASGVPGLAPYGVRVRLQSAPPALSRWKSGVQKFQAPAPGVVPVPAAASSAQANAASKMHWCARWPLFLRAVPARCLLVIDSERPASLYVNGARLLHSWSGRRTVEVSGALLQGANLLALEWMPPQDGDATAGRSAAPVVRYEWLVAQ